MRREFTDDLDKLRRRYAHRPGIERRAALEAALRDERAKALREGELTRTPGERAFDSLMGSP